MGRLRSIMPPVFALIALLAGLAPAVLETGQVDPLDWLLPCGLALLALLLLEGRAKVAGKTWQLGGAWLLVAAPALLLCATIATRLPVAGLIGLGAALALLLLAMAFAARRGPLRFWGVAALLLIPLAGPTIAHRFQIVQTRTAGPLVGVLSALPLQGATGQEHGHDALRAVGLRSPLWQALAARFTLQPLDGLDAQQLARFKTLLLAQPRQLAPAELVALDRWVREGGHVVILADPLLRWPDPRPLAHPRRAPMTSLLDPLLQHWGLTLEPVRETARGGIERRPLRDGLLLQLAGASRFTPMPASPCAVAEDGLIARCRIGKGTTALVADADWINDDLWTLAPETPAAERRWTSDAVPVLAGLLGAQSVAPARSWLRDERALYSGLRWALVLLLAMGLAPMMRRMRPRLSHALPRARRDQRKNMVLRSPNSS